MSLPYLSNWDAFAIDADEGRWDNLHEAIVAFCAYEFAYAIKQDGMGEAGYEQFAEALANDGYTKDDEDAAREYLSRVYDTYEKQAAQLVDEARRVKRLALIRGAKTSVVRFIQSLAMVPA